MKSDRKIGGVLREQNGSVLILSVCIMMFLSVLSMLLLKTTSNLVRFHERSVKMQQCEMLAVSVARVLQDEIERMEYEADVLTDDAGFLKYGLVDCEFPADVSLEIWKMDAASELRVTVICEWDDVAKQVTYWCQRKGGESETDELEVE